MVCFKQSFHLVRKFFILPHKPPGIFLDPLFDTLVFRFFALRSYFFQAILRLPELRIVAFCDLLFPLLHRLADGFCNRTLFSLEGTL